MPGYIDPKFRDGAQEPQMSWLQTIGVIILGFFVCFVVGAFAVFYLVTEMLPSLNH